MKVLQISAARGLGSVFFIGCQGEEWDGEVLRDEPLLLCIVIWLSALLQDGLRSWATRETSRLLILSLAYQK